VPVYLYLSLYIASVNVTVSYRNFGKYKPTFKILSPNDSEETLQRNRLKIIFILPVANCVAPTTLWNLKTKNTTHFYLDCLLRYTIVNTTVSKDTSISASICHFLCSVISQGKVVALVSWGGKWNHLSMTPRLTTDYGKNYCNRTLSVKVIVENVVTCFYGTQCIIRPLPIMSSYRRQISKPLWWYISVKIIRLCWTFGKMQALDL